MKQTKMDLTNLISDENLRLSSSKNLIKKIFFYKVCGAGMGPAAVLLKEAGFQVEGADSSFYPPMSDYLKTTRMPLYHLSEVDSHFLQKYDLIVVGNSLAKKSQEARLIESCGVPFTSFPAALGNLVLNQQNVVGIAGTHGKTTTTYFMVQLLEKLGKKPGYLIGGILDDRGPSRLGEDYFVIESDEYDSAYFHKISKFRFYQLNHLILTSLEFDHADIFSGIEDIENEFNQILPHFEGRIIFNSDYESCRKISQINSLKNKPFFYGLASDHGPLNIVHSKMGSSFSILWQEEEIKFKSSVVGDHNILNLTSCILFLLAEGFDKEKIQSAVQDVSLVKRRQEIRGYYHGGVVIDDFAHHPRAITETLKATRNRFPDKKIITVFEPISATARSSIFQEEFKDSLLFSDIIIIAKSSLPTTALQGENLDVELLVKEINNQGKKALAVTELTDLRFSIDQFMEDESVLLILSNRTCLGLWESNFVKELSSVIQDKGKILETHGHGVQTV